MTAHAFPFLVLIKWGLDIQLSGTEVIFDSAVRVKPDIYGEKQSMLTSDHAELSDLRTIYLGSPLQHHLAPC